MYSYDDPNDVKDVKDINSSFNMMKREKFTKDFENSMWKFLVRKLKDPEYAPARKPNGLLLWRDFIMETKSTRSAMNLATHFRKSMRANIMFSELSNEDICFIYAELKWCLGQREEALFEQRKHGFPLLNDEKVLKKKRKLLVSENDESGYVMTSDDQVKNGMKKQRGIKKEVLNDISKNVTHMPKLLSQDTPSKSDDLPKKSKLEDAIGKLREKAGLDESFNVTECTIDDLEDSVSDNNNDSNNSKKFFDIQKEESSSSSDDSIILDTGKRRGRPRKPRKKRNSLIESLVNMTSSNLLNSTLLPPIGSVQMTSASLSNRNNFSMNDFEKSIDGETVMSELTNVIINKIFQHINDEESEINPDLYDRIKKLRGFKYLNDIVNECSEFFKKEKRQNESDKSGSSSNESDNQLEINNEIVTANEADETNTNRKKNHKKSKSPTQKDDCNTTKIADDFESADNNEGRVPDSQSTPSPNINDANIQGQPTDQDVVINNFANSPSPILSSLPYF